METIYYLPEGGEDSLPYLDRLGLAFCRINSREWDCFIGPKPWDFDDLPDYCTKEDRATLDRPSSKSDYIGPAMRLVEQELAKAASSWAWWRFGLNRNQADWSKWYLEQNHPHLLSAVIQVTQEVGNGGPISGQEIQKPCQDSGANHRQNRNFYLRLAVYGLIGFLLGHVLAKLTLFLLG